MTIKPFYRHYTLDTVNRHPDAFFVFGDNRQGWGRGPQSGQAIIRDAPNAIGIITKHEPTNKTDAFLYNEDASLFRMALERAEARLIPLLEQGADVYWPADGLGTGRADMPNKAPVLYKMLCDFSRGLFQKYGDRPLMSAIVCGGRDFGDLPKNWRDLSPQELETVKERAAKEKAMGKDYLSATFGALPEGTFLEIIEGGAKGADKIGQEWAKEQGRYNTCVPADWNRHKKAAGFIRNSDMANRLTARRDQLGADVMVIGMPGGKGTKMMLDISKTAGFPVHCLDPEAPIAAPALAPKSTPSKSEVQSMFSQLVDLSAKNRSAGRDASFIEIHRQENGALKARVTHRLAADVKEGGKMYQGSHAKLDHDIGQLALQLHAEHSRSRALDGTDQTGKVAMVAIETYGEATVTAPRSPGDKVSTWITEDGFEGISCTPLRAQDVAAAFSDRADFPSYENGKATYDACFAKLSESPFDPDDIEAAANALIEGLSLEDSLPARDALIVEIDKRLYESRHGKWDDDMINEFDALSEGEDLAPEPS